MMHNQEVEVETLFNFFKTNLERLTTKTSFPRAHDLISKRYNENSLIICSFPSPRNFSFIDDKTLCNLKRPNHTDISHCNVLYLIVTNTRYTFGGEYPASLDHQKLYGNIFDNKDLRLLCKFIVTLGVDINKIIYDVLKQIVEDI